jgi:hypothetical protein
MKIKEFFKNTKKTLGLETLQEDISKKERLVDLLNKLNSNIMTIKEELQNDLEEEKRAELEEELLVYKLQIKKGQEILDRKNNK